MCKIGVKRTWMDGVRKRTATRLGSFYNIVKKLIFIIYKYDDQLGHGKTTI